MEYSKLMHDSSENDGKAEAILDYVLSWCLRRAESSCNNEKPILYGKCRYMLGKLLGLKNLKDVEFRYVKTYKQWKAIDLCVEVEVEIAGNIKKHAILIENKYYTGLHSNQLERYKTEFDSCYKKKNEKWELHYALICCYETDDPKIHQYDDEADRNGFTIYAFDEMIEDYEDTESDIFNEFWNRKW